MGKISVYQSRQLVSSAVGVPQQDRSGEIIAQGVMQGAQGVIGLMAERKAKATDLETDVKMSDFSMAYGEAKGRAMTLYRDKPEAFPKAVRDHGAQLIEDFASKMEPGVAESFKAKASSFITSDTANSMQWSRQRDQQIIIGNVEKGYNNLELTSQNARTPEALKNVLTAIDAHSVKAQNFIDFSSDNALKTRTKAAAKDNALTSRILSDSRGMVSALESGEYKDVLEPQEISKYLKMAKTAAIYDATVEQYRSLTTSGAQISDMSARLKDGTLPVTEINLQLEWAKLHENEVDINGERVVPASYVEALENMRDIKLKQDPRTAEQKRADAAEYTKTWQTAWSKYLYEKPDKKAGVKDYNDVISLYTKALRANQNGILNDAQFAGVRKILDTQLKASMGSKNMSVGITEALNNAATKQLNLGDQWFNTKENVYSAGYKQIGDYFKKRTDLPIADKQRQTEDMLIKYTETLDAMPQEQKDRIQNAEKAAADILNGYNKEGKISPGLFDRLTVIRNAKTGEIYQKNQIIHRNGGAYMVVGNDPNTGEPLFKPVKVK